MAQEIYDTAENANYDKGIISKKGETHLEPNTGSYNPLLAQFTVGFFKTHGLGNAGDFGIDWENMIFGDDEDSICGGGDGVVIDEMCEVVKF